MWLSDKERKEITTADELDIGFSSPVPTQVVSNGEYNPPPQTEKQRQVEGRIKELADQYARKLNMDRRQFLKTASGMAVAFLAMNQVFGPVWDVSEAEAADLDMANERAKALKGQFIFDDQTHFVRDDFDKEGLLGLGKYAAEHWNPDMLKDMPLVLQRYKFQNYLKEVYLDSDTKVALLSSAPFDDPDWWLLMNDQIVAARQAINKVAGSRRMFAHTVVTPGQGNWMEEQVERGIAEFKPDSWKCYTIGDPLAPSSRGTAWRLDDEKLVYPWYEKAVKAGINTICIHKGLLPRDYEQSWPGVWKHATVDDVLKAAKDWPQINFVIYHGALRMFLEDPAYTLDNFEKTGRIDWTTDVCELASKHGLKNVYAELGTTFATCAVASPRLAGAMIGQFVNEMGEDHVVWGTDSVWYGSPQWQIEAMRRLEIPEDIMKKMGWKKKLGGPDSKVKRMIFGENSARIYKYKIQSEYEDLTHDQLALMKQMYESEGVTRNNVAYGYVHKRSA
ncbi:MAG TPA: amidohydrolase family protein [Burkholderiales bacterium]|jgi:predicted TIM-barrel fold metal-dependent hydrolase|nr:amidohydrolase family protein [Burkholderiales bacterium]